ncbi:MAG: glycosyltransferase family 25 protein [Sphingomonadaceae bacterium]|nr:glycosyltransferase family 25 protein [Sphingomonadaceae bacterium]
MQQSAPDIEPIDAAENLLVIGHAQLGRLDRSAYAALQRGGDPGEEVASLIMMVRALRTDIGVRYPRFLNAAGHIALQCLTSAALFEDTVNPVFLVNRAKALHFLGLTKLALEEVERSDLAHAERRIADQLFEMYCDMFAYKRADELVTAATARRSSFAISMEQRLGEHRARFKAAKRSLVAGSPQAAVHVINLPRDRYRKIAMENRLAFLATPHRFVNAVSSDDVPAELEHLIASHAARPLDGSFGNQLSQYRIWKSIAAGELPFGIVLEDDAFVTVPGLDRIDFAALMGDLDIAFFNDRLSRWRGEVARPELACRPLPDVLAELAISHPMLRAFGSDGYVLSAAGAAKLVAIAEREGFHSIGTDWYLLSHSVSAAGQERLAEPSVLRDRLRVAERKKTEDGPVLRGGVISPPLAEHRPLGVWRSTRVTGG